MSSHNRPGFCDKALWYGWGGDAGHCDKPAWGPTPKGYGRREGETPLLWACPEHGGPPQCPETDILRNHFMKAATKGEGKEDGN